MYTYKGIYKYVYMYMYIYMYKGVCMYINTYIYIICIYMCIYNITVKSGIQALGLSTIGLIHGLIHVTSRVPSVKKA